jgi:hypothetical protein
MFRHIAGLKEPAVGVRARSKVFVTCAPRRVLATSFICGEKKFTQKRRCR